MQAVPRISRKSYCPNATGVPGFLFVAVATTPELTCAKFFMVKSVPLWTSNKILEDFHHMQVLELILLLKDIQTGP